MIRVTVCYNDGEGDVLINPDFVILVQPMLPISGSGVARVQVSMSGGYTLLVKGTLREVESKLKIR